MLAFGFQVAPDSLKALISLPKIAQDWLLLSYRADRGGGRSGRNKHIDCRPRDHAVDPAPVQPAPARTLQRRAGS